MAEWVEILGQLTGRPPESDNWNPPRSPTPPGPVVYAGSRRSSAILEEENEQWSKWTSRNKEMAEILDGEHKMESKFEKVNDNEENANDLSSEIPGTKCAETCAKPLPSVLPEPVKTPILSQPQKLQIWTKPLHLDSESDDGFEGVKWDRIRVDIERDQKGSFYHNYHQQNISSFLIESEAKHCTNRVTQAEKLDIGPSEDDEVDLSKTDILPSLSQNLSSESLKNENITEEKSHSTVPNETENDILDSLEHSSLTTASVNECEVPSEIVEKTDKVMTEETDVNVNQIDHNDSSDYDSDSDDDDSSDDTSSDDDDDDDDTSESDTTSNSDSEESDDSSDESTSENDSDSDASTSDSSEDSSEDSDNDDDDDDKTIINNVNISNDQTVQLLTFKSLAISDNDITILSHPDANTFLPGLIFGNESANLKYLESTAHFDTPVSPLNQVLDNSRRSRSRTRRNLGSRTVNQKNLVNKNNEDWDNSGIQKNRNVILYYANNVENNLGTINEPKFCEEFGQVDFRNTNNNQMKIPKYEWWQDGELHQYTEKEKSSKNNNTEDDKVSVECH